MTLVKKFQNLQKESSVLLMIKITQNMANNIKMIPALNLRQKSLIQVFMIIQMDIFS